MTRAEKVAETYRLKRERQAERKAEAKKIHAALAAVLDDPETTTEQRLEAARMLTEQKYKYF